MLGTTRTKAGEGVAERNKSDIFKYNPISLFWRETSYVPWREMRDANVPASPEVTSRDVITLCVMTSYPPKNPINRLAAMVP